MGLRWSLCRDMRLEKRLLAFHSSIDSFLLHLLTQVDPFVFLLGYPGQLLLWQGYMH